MWKLIRSFFARSPAGEGRRSAEQISDQPQVDFELIKSEVEDVLKLDLTSKAAREAHADLVLDTLRHLDAEVEKIRRQGNGYPANPISALVWLNGAGYGNLACALTYLFATQTG